LFSLRFHLVGSLAPHICLKIRFLESAMAPTSVPPTQKSSDIGVVGSIGITVGMVLLIVCVGYLTHRFRPKVPINAAEHQRLREAKLKKDTRSRILHTIPVVKYNLDLRKCKAKPVTKFCNLAPIITTPRRETNVRQESPQGGYLEEDNEQLEVPGPLTQSIKNGVLLERHETSKRESESCSICTEAFQKGEKVRMLPCSHIYHRHCIDPWLLDFAGTCPLW